MKMIKRTQQNWPRDYLNTIFSEMLSPLNYDDETQAESSTWSPAVDIKEEQDKYIVKADIPGVEKDNIDLSLEDGILTIKGERNYEKTEEKEGFSRVERIQGQFYRRFALPDSTDESKIKASYKKGVLEVMISKQEKKKAKKIDVKIED